MIMPMTPLGQIVKSHELRALSNVPPLDCPVVGQLDSLLHRMYAGSCMVRLVAESKLIHYLLRM